MRSLIDKIYALFCNHALMYKIIAFLIIITFALLLCSCGLQKPIIKEQQRDIIRVEHQIDSVYILERDSIFVDRYKSNDTVYLTIEKWLTRYKDKIIEVRDTVEITTQNTDTIQVKYVPTFYKGCTISFWIIIVLILLFIAFKVVKKVYLKR